jgi:hypothetical protein
MAQRVAIPDRVHARELLDRVDYGDAFAVEAGPHVLARYSPDELAELALGRAPGWVRVLVRVAHGRVLRLRLAASEPPVPVPGWHLVSSGPDAVVYGVAGGLITPRIVVMKESRRIVVVTLMRLDHRAAGPIVAAIKPVHRAVARYLLDRGARLAAAELPSDSPR